MSIGGIGLAFLVFWSIGAVGLYLALSGLSRIRQSHASSRRGLSSVRTANAGASMLAVVNILVVLLGLLLVFEGFWLTYSVIFR